MNFSNEVKEATVKTFGRQYPVAKGYTCVVMNSKIETYNEQEVLVLEIDVAEGECQGCYSSNLKRVFINLEGTTPWGESNAERAKKTLTTIINDNIGIFEENEDIFNNEFEEKRLCGCTVGVVFKWDPNNTQFVKPNYICSKAYAEKKAEAPKPVAKTISEEFTTEEEAPKQKSLFGKK